MRFLILLAVVAAGCAGPARPPLPPSTPTSHTFTPPFPDGYNVALLVMDGVYNTELTAPYDIFEHTAYRTGIRPMNVFTVGKTRMPVRSFEGLHFTPDFGFLTDSIPPIDILVVPSAEHHLDSDLEDAETLDFIRQAGGQATYITSHCDGAFMLAEAGLLEGRVSTTFPSDVAAMRERYPHLDIRDNVLFVHDGPVITSAGGAKSFEAALYLSEVMYGDSIARALAKGLVIDWDADAVPHTVIPQE